MVRGSMVGTESVARPGPVLPAGDRFGRCAIVDARRRDAASLDAEGREPAIGGKRVPRLREVLKHFTRLAYVGAACVSLIVPHRQYRLGPFDLQWSVPRNMLPRLLTFVFPVP